MAIFFNKSKTCSRNDLSQKQMFVKIQKNSRQESGLCDTAYVRYLEKPFTQIYKAWYGDAMLVSYEGHIFGRLKPTETFVFEFSSSCINSLLEELVKI